MHRSHIPNKIVFGFRDVSMLNCHSDVARRELLVSISYGSEMNYTLLSFERSHSVSMIFLARIKPDRRGPGQRLLCMSCNPGVRKCPRDLVAATTTTTPTAANGQGCMHFGIAPIFGSSPKISTISCRKQSFLSLRTSTEHKTDVVWFSDTQTTRHHRRLCSFAQSCWLRMENNADGPPNVNVQRNATQRCRMALNLWMDGRTCGYINTSFRQWVVAAAVRVCILIIESILAAWHDGCSTLMQTSSRRAMCNYYAAACYRYTIDWANTTCCTIWLNK